MPVPVNDSFKSSFDVQICLSTKDFPQKALTAMEANPVAANVILPTFLKRRAKEERTGLPNADYTWLVCYDSPSRTEVRFIASITRGMMGNYPLFIFSVRPRQSLDDGELYFAMEALSQALDASVPQQRVYSVFAVDIVAEAFAAVWSRRAGIESYTRPYYDSTISFCSKRNIAPVRQNTILPDIEHECCPASREDIPAIGKLCEMFAAESEPFVLTPSQGQEEGEKLVTSGQVWVHRIRRGNGPSEIASIVAYTRNCNKVATITKVYTNPKWRKLGCAERLVRRVCKHLLYSTDPKEYIALFVGNDNPAAKVYNRVGFLGLDKSKGPVEGVDRWVEIGFDRRFVQQGHW
ncbi:hypothetical protein DFP72DRAFT_32159 [Ephemerocybe angulata]|uniref:GCN5-related N-acetyltransferase Rv2170-like domain-containing protein n=1 Tax=Ephemerocybe angulata TaxID=980116 RepID=A0A8H6I914_9AGAR|nr:hypothetical protein DFP72DRAFT_32159 [Tulosesus angulatus]